MKQQNDSIPRLFLLDAYALIYRSYFAFIKNPRYNSKGLNTSTMFGFTNTLKQLLNKENPSHMAVAFDMHKPTFRHKLYPEYKANREVMPEDIRLAVPWVKKIIQAYNIPIIEKAGFEADDVIGTMAKRAEKEGFQVYMVTPDKDYAQLVSENIKMYKPGHNSNGMEIWGKSEVCEKFGIKRPEQVIDILALMGDTADNIPGCPGIGPKTAGKLIYKYDSVDGLYNHVQELKGKQKEKVIENEKQVRLSRKLAEIILDVPVSFNREDLLINDPDSESLKNIFNELEFKGLAQKTEKKKVSNEMTFEQGTLFGEATSAPEEEQNKLNIENTDHRYFMVENEMQRASLRADLSVQKEFCFDTETTGLDVHKAELVCISFSFKKGEAYCVKIPSEKDDAKKIVQEFRLIFQDPKILKIGQNIKYDIEMLLQYGLEVKGPCFDTMIAHYLIQPEIRHNLDYLCDIYLSYKKVETESLIGKKGKGQKTMRQVSDDQLRDYSCEDADLTLQLKQKIDPELDKTGVRKVFEEIEMPLIPVLTDMEMTGVTLDTNVLNSYSGVLRDRLSELEKEIKELAGVDFNISSPKQLGPILFDKLKIDDHAKKTKTKQYSTSEEVLSKLVGKHPIVEKILKYRGLKKLLSTYVESLPKLINPKTGKIHTSYNQAVTSTGRLSSTNPNLQNIPIRDDEGKEIRKAFKSSDKDHVFLSADYSQVELRIMAALSKDKHMSQAFIEGIDVHALTASKIYNVSLDEVTPDMRRKAKVANFGMIYGISVFGLSQRLNIPRGEAKILIDGYFKTFSRIKDFMKESIDIAREKGYVETIMGRRRYLSDINSANSIVRGVAERNAINAPVQGSAADIIKLAMIHIYNDFMDQHLKSKMVLQVHDELNFDVPLSELDQVKKIVKHRMEHVVDLGIPLTIEMNDAPNWLEAH